MLLKARKLMTYSDPGSVNHEKIFYGSLNKVWQQMQLFAHTQFVNRKNPLFTVDNLRVHIRNPNSPSDGISPYHDVRVIRRRPVDHDAFGRGADPQTGRLTRHPQFVQIVAERLSVDPFGRGAGAVNIRGRNAQQIRLAAFEISDCEGPSHSVHRDDIGFFGALVPVTNFIARHDAVLQVGGRWLPAHGYALKISNDISHWWVPVM